MRLPVAALLLLTAAALAQTRKQTFEVTSVKLNSSDLSRAQIDVQPRRSGDRVIMHNTQVAFVFNYAYNIGHTWQMDGNIRLPDGWKWYDVEAIAPESTSDADLRLMFQSLLEDRFRLRVHREIREISGWSLAIGKGGIKLTPAVQDSVIATEGRPVGAGKSMVGRFSDAYHVMGKGATVEQLAVSLSGRLGAPVHDRTGLTGTYDYNVAYHDDDGGVADITSAPRLADALQSELGLKLEPTKETTEVVVIDHIEKPTPN